MIFENDLIQIGIKCEFRQNLGRLAIYYGNKTPFPLTAFAAECSATGNLGAQLNIQAKPCEGQIEGGAQSQQMINVECVDDFLEKPNLNVTFW